MRTLAIILAAGLAACATTGGGTTDTGTPTDSPTSHEGGADTGVDVASDTPHAMDASDTGNADSHPGDTGPMDSHPSDTGPGDTGPGDSGPTDTGPTDTGSGCGTCRPGFSCSPHGYCVSTRGVPAFGHVYLLMMENHSLSSIMGSADAPYVNMLMNSYSYATHYVTRTSGAIHPSCPNYIAITSGDTHGVTCDCVPSGASFSIQAACFGTGTSANCPQAVTGHLGDVLETASIPWRAYGDSMGTPCNTADSGDYVVRHIPFLYYNNIRTDSARCMAHVRDYGTDFATDLAAGTYRFSMISPNLCHDMHGNGTLGFGDTCSPNDTRSGDDWLSMEIPNLLATPGFAASGTDVLFIVWDEEDGSTGSSPIPMIMVSPLVRPGSTTPVAYDHYSVLGTILEGLGLPATRIGSAEAMAAPVITDVWR